ncbi:WD40 repeat domain-containing protein [Streptomyces sp. JNUCC 64]
MSSDGVRDGEGNGRHERGGRWDDPVFLVHGEPARVRAALDAAPGARARSVAAVYRASAHRHRDAPPAVRRQSLALDAARYGDRELSARITAVPVAGAERARWGFDWATAGGTDSRARYVLPGWKAPCVATAVVAGRAVAVGPSLTGDDHGRALRMWDLLTGDPVGAPLTGHTGAVRAVATCALDGRAVALTGSEDGTVRLWDLAAPAPLGGPLSGHDGWVLAAATAEVDGRTVLVTGGSDTTARVWDPRTGRQLGAPFTGHGHWVESVATAVVDGRAVAVTGGAYTRVRVWDLATGQELHAPLTDRADRVAAVATTVVDGRPVAVTGGDDRTVRVWDLATGEPVGDPLTGHGGRVTSVATAEVAGRPVAVTGGADTTVRIWDLTTHQELHAPLSGHTDRVGAVAVAAVDGVPFVVSAGDVRTTGRADHDVRVWDLGEARRPGGAPDRHREPVLALTSATVDGRSVIVSGSADGTARRWDPATGERTGAPFTGHDGGVHTVAAGTVEGRPVAVTGGHDALRCWDLATGGPLGGPLTDPDGGTHAWAPGTLDGRPVVVTGGGPGAGRPLRLWDPVARGPVGAFPTGRHRRHSDRVVAVAVGVVDGLAVAVTSADDRTVRMWDARTGRPVGGPLADDLPVRSLAVAEPGGRPLVVLGGGTGAVRIVDLATRRTVGDRPRGHADVVGAVALGTVAGRPVAVTGGWDGTVCVWDAVTGGRIGEEIVFPAVVRAVAVTPDGLLVVGYGPDLAVLSPR